MNIIFASIGDSPSALLEDVFDCSNQSTHSQSINHRTRSTITVGTSEFGLLNPRSQIIEQDGYLAVLDGSFYHRQNSLDDFSRNGSMLPVSNDIKWLVAAYREYGKEFLKHIVGDFSFAIWDPDDEHLFCARDRTGVRSLYYTEVENSVFISSALEPLLAHPNVDLAINEGLLAEHLIDSLTTRDETFYNSIQQLPAGMALSVNSSGTEQYRYWNPTDQQLLNCSPSKSPTAQLRDLLERVVSDHITQPQRTAVLMSGGLDSTTIAALAQQTTDEVITALSAVFDELPDMDERKKIADVGSYCSLDLQYIQGDEHWPFSKTTEYKAALVGGPRFDMNLPLNDTLYRTAASRDFPILLTGIGGNAFDGTRLSYTQRLTQREYLGVARDMIYDDVSTFKLFRWYVMEQLAPGLTTRLNDLAGAEPAPSPANSVGPTLQATVDFDSRLRSTAMPAEWGAETRHLWRNDLGVHRDLALAAERRLGQKYGVTFRYPLLDARLVEFVFALSPRQRFCAGKKKRLFREAVDGLLPEKVRTQKKTVDFAPLATRGFRNKEADFVRSLRNESRLIEHGYITDSRFDNVMDSYFKGYNNKLTPLWHLLAAELWLRQCEKQWLS